MRFTYATSIRLWIFKWAPKFLPLTTWDALDPTVLLQAPIPTKSCKWRPRGSRFPCYVTLGRAPFGQEPHHESKHITNTIVQTLGDIIVMKECEKLHSSCRKRSSNLNLKLFFFCMKIQKTNAFIVY